VQKNIKINDDKVICASLIPTHSCPKKRNPDPSTGHLAELFATAGMKRPWQNTTPEYASDVLTGTTTEPKIAGTEQRPASAVSRNTEWATPAKSQTDHQLTE
jgi:hypothetical protein